MIEDDLLGAVMDICALRHCLVHHCRPARTEDGKWRTPIQGHAGFVDLVIAGKRGVLFRELKSDHGKATADQTAWLGRLEMAGADAGLWKPQDLASGRIADEIKEIA